MNGTCFCPDEINNEKGTFRIEVKGDTISGYLIKSEQEPQIIIEGSIGRLCPKCWPYYSYEGLNIVHNFLIYSEKHSFL